MVCVVENWVTPRGKTTGKMKKEKATLSCVMLVLTFSQSVQGSEHPVTFVTIKPPPHPVMSIPHVSKKVSRFEMWALF